MNKRIIFFGTAAIVIVVAFVWMAGRSRAQNPSTSDTITTPVVAVAKVGREDLSQQVT